MKKSLLLLSLLGLAFSGYLSGVTYFSTTCAFNESCPYVLGYPTCYYGFALFLALAVVTLLLSRGILERVSAYRLITAIATLGILFAGYFTMTELDTFFIEDIRAFALGLPTCAWGLIVYVTILVVTLRAQGQPEAL